MGHWLSYFWWGGDPDEVNPVSGLTRREIYAVQKSWAPVFANALVNGSELFRRFFQTYPEAKEFFKLIRKMPKEEFMQTAQFKAHVMNLMTSLNLAVTSLNQPEIVAAMMNKIGESHKKRQIKENNFGDLKQVLVKMFIEVLHLDGDTLTAWDKTITFWYKHIFETLNTADESR